MRRLTGEGRSLSHRHAAREKSWALPQACPGGLFPGRPWGPRLVTDEGHRGLPARLRQESGEGALVTVTRLWTNLAMLSQEGVPGRPLFCLLDTGFPTGRRPPTTVSKFSLPTSAAALRGRREQGQWAGLPQPQWQICFMKAFENSTLHSTTQDKVPYTRDFPVLCPGGPTARIGELRGVGDLFISARPQAELGPGRQLPGHGCTPTPCRPRSPHLTRHT